MKFDIKDSNSFDLGSQEMPIQKVETDLLSKILWALKNILIQVMDQGPFFIIAIL